MGKQKIMGNFNFLWEFTPLILMISPVRREQGQKGGFDHAEPGHEHGGKRFSLCSTLGGCIFAKIVFVELNQTKLIYLYI